MAGRRFLQRGIRKVQFVDGKAADLSFGSLFLLINGTCIGTNTDLRLNIRLVWVLRPRHIHPNPTVHKWHVPEAVRHAPEGLDQCVIGGVRKNSWSDCHGKNLIQRIARQ